MFETKSEKINILIVEDDNQILEALEYTLNKNGFNTFISETKSDALNKIEKEELHLILLDVQLPDGNGFDICKKIREYSDIPIIFLTGRGEELNVVYGLDIGADDYIIKPFGNQELLSRINSVLRRYNKNINKDKVINYRNIRIEIEKAKVFKENNEIFLTNLEYKILLMFVNNINKLITREQILEKVWDIDEKYVNSNTLSVYIKRLREKIGDTYENEMIKTIRGIGYILCK